MKALLDVLGHDKEIREGASVGELQMPHAARTRGQEVVFGVLPLIIMKHAK